MFGNTMRLVTSTIVRRVGRSLPAQLLRELGAVRQAVAETTTDWAPLQLAPSSSAGVLDLKEELGDSVVSCRS